MKSSLNLLIEINKQQTANERGHQFSRFFFWKKAKANNKSVTLSLAPLAYNNGYKKFLEQRCDIFRLILHRRRLRFFSQWACACVLRSEKSFSAKFSNETSFKMDGILICTRFVSKSKGTYYTLFAVNNLQRDSTLPYTHPRRPRGS